jgi:mono/diheme cytochrome c family protein
MRHLKIALVILVVALLANFGYAHYRQGGALVDHGVTDGPLTLSGTAIERGQYLAAAADCTACHTMPGGDAYAGGVAFELPFGTLYSSNLTPDAQTGIGGWSDDEFVNAVRAGIGRGGRHLYPAHPYTTYSGMARNDVLAIKAYLDSLSPVQHAVPNPTLTFPYSQRGLMTLWNAFFQPDVGYQPDAAHDARWNRGAYLANALGHCGECHTPRNVAYALKRGQALSGAITRGWKAYDITATGLAHWSAADLDRYLATGHATGHGSTVGPMKEVVLYSTAQLTPDDRAALVEYLLAGRSGEVAAQPAPQSVANAQSLGASLYAGACAGCHALTPSPVAASFADLTGASTVRDPAGTNLLKLLAEGSPHGEGVGLAMPAFGEGYSAAERAALANYVLAQWGGLPPALTAKDAQAAEH